MRFLYKINSAFAGLLIIVIGGMIPSAIFIPGIGLEYEIYNLPISWQVPALLLNGLVCGSEAGLISTFSYITLGLFYLPVFHGGGSIGYIGTPDFGYLVGFLPAVWVVGRMVENNKKNSLLYLFI